MFTEIESFIETLRTYLQQCSSIPDWRSLLFKWEMNESVKGVFVLFYSWVGPLYVAPLSETSTYGLPAEDKGPLAPWWRLHCTYNFPISRDNFPFSRSIMVSSIIFWLDREQQGTRSGSALKILCAINTGFPSGRSGSFRIAVTFQK
jgi:hypothetical protein